MKTRIYAAVAILAATIFTGFAQRTNGIILSSSGKVHSFYEYQLADAYNVANPGDTIYLGYGSYTFDFLPETTYPNGNVAKMMDKPLTFIGAGADEGKDCCRVGWTDLCVSVNYTGDKVSFEGIRYYGGIHIKSADEVTFRNSHIDSFEILDLTNKLIVDRSKFENFNIGAGLLNSMQAVNSNITQLNGYCKEGESLASFNHCWFDNVNKETAKAYILNSYLEWVTEGNVAFENCFFKYHNGDESKMILTNCTQIDGGIDLYGMNLDKSISEAYGFYCSDGTVPGVMGGTQPYSLSPSYPMPDAENSSVTYDSVNKKLNIKVKVLTD